MVVAVLCYYADSIIRTECRDSACCYQCCLVCVCLSVEHNHELCQTAEPIEIRDAICMWTRVGPTNRVLVGAQEPPGEGTFFLWEECPPL